MSPAPAIARKPRGTLGGEITGSAAGGMRRAIITLMISKTRKATATIGKRSLPNVFIGGASPRYRRIGGRTAGLQPVWNTIAGSSRTTRIRQRTLANMQISTTAAAVIGRSCQGVKKASSVLCDNRPKTPASPTPRQ